MIKKHQLIKCFKKTYPVVVFSILLKIDVKVGLNRQFGKAWLNVEAKSCLLSEKVSEGKVSKLALYDAAL